MKSRNDWQSAAPSDGTIETWAADPFGLKSTSTASKVNVNNPVQGKERCTLKLDPGRRSKGTTQPWDSYLARQNGAGVRNQGTGARLMQDCKHELNRGAKHDIHDRQCRTRRRPFCAANTLGAVGAQPWSWAWYAWVKSDQGKVTDKLFVYGYTSLTHYELLTITELDEIIEIVCNIRKSGNTSPLF